MTTRQPQLRLADMSSPEKSAKVLTDALMDISKRLDALERSEFFELEVTTDAASSAAVTLPKPRWPVRAVYVAQVYNITASNDDYLSQSLMWHQSQAGIVIPIIYFSSANTRYKLTLEVRG